MAAIEETTKTLTADHPVSAENSQLVGKILRALTGLDYGSVQIVVQDSKVVQIERTQRSRFAHPLQIP